MNTNGGKCALDEALEAARGLHAEDFLRAQAAQERTATAALCALYREGKRREAVKSLSLRSMVVAGMDDEQVYQQMRVLEEPVVHHLERMLRRLDEDTTEAAQLAWAREARRALRPPAPPKRASTQKKKKAATEKKKKEMKKKKEKKAKKEEEEERSDVEGDGIMYKDFFGDDKVDDDEEVNRMLVDEDKQQELEDVLGQHDSDLDLGADISDGSDGEPREVFEEDPFDDSIFETKDHDDEDDEDEKDDEDENEDEEEEEKENKSTEHSEDENENENEDEDESKGEDKKTSHEAEQELIQKRISKLEDANVGDKPWTLAGEVSVADRPVDSLLDTYVEFQSGTHEPPVVSPAMTAELTQLIQKRVADGTWDDIEPRALAAEPAARPRAERLTPEEEARRAKMGLGEVYEEEYRRQLERMTAQSGALLRDDAAPTPQQAALERELAQICRELDVLANFHYTPEPVDRAGRSAGSSAGDDEVKVLPNAPSIAMEEIVPMAVSSATLLAPEEVYSAKATALKKTPEEMTREERRAAHNARKREVRRARIASGAAAAAEGAAPAAGAGAGAGTAGARLKWGTRDGVGRTASSITSDAAPVQRRFRSKAFFAALQHEQTAAPAPKKARSASGASSAAKL